MTRDARFGGRFSCIVNHPSLCKDLINLDQNVHISADACEDKNQGNLCLDASLSDTDITKLFKYIVYNTIALTLVAIILACPINYVPISCPNYPICIPGTMLCNGIDDCGDNIDESTDMCK